MTLAKLSAWPYSHLAVANSAARIGVLISKADTPPLSGFLCPQHGKPSMGGPCVGIVRCAGPSTGTPTRTVPPSLIGVREAEKQTASKETRP